LATGITASLAFGNLGTGTGNDPIESAMRLRDIVLQCLHPLVESGLHACFTLLKLRQQSRLELNGVLQ